MSDNEEQKPAAAGRGRGRGAKPAYKVKDEGEKEEPQVQTGEEEKKAPQARRGGRTADGNRQQRRPRVTEEGKEEEKTGEQKEGQRPARVQNNRRDQGDPSSWINQFHKSRKNFDYDIEITSDFVIPEKPKPLLKEPDKNELNKVLKALDKKIDDYGNEKKKLISKRMEKQKSAGGTVTVRDQLNNLIGEQKRLTKQKHGMIGEMRAEKQAVLDLIKQKNGLEKNMHPQYKNEKDIVEALAEMQQTLTTTTKSAQVEAQLVKDIQKCKQSLPFAASLAKIEPRKKEHDENKKAIFGKLQELDVKIKEQEAEITGIRAQLDLQIEDKTEQRKDADSIKEKINHRNQQISECYESKDSTKDEYWKAMFMAREQRDEIVWIDWIVESKDMLKGAAAEREKHIASMKDEIAYVKNPLEKEIGTCQYLIGVCQRLKVTSGLVQDEAKVARETANAIQQTEILARQDKMIKEGRLEVGMTKQQIEQAGMISVGGGKKKNKGRKTEAQVMKVTQQEDPFTHDIDIVQKFTTVNVGPPHLPADLDGKIEQLQEKEKELVEKGKERLEKEIQELTLAMAEAEANFDDQASAARKVAAEERGKGGRGGRGGYGRGSRGGEGRGRGGRGARGADRGGRGGRRDAGESYGDREEAGGTHDSNKEFEDFDDDSVYKQAPRPQTGAQKQNQKSKGNFVFKADDFDAL